MVDSVTEISKVLLGQGFQQVPAPLGETIMDITDLSGITAVAYGGKVCVLPQTYQAYLEKQLDNYPTAKGIFTIGYVYHNHQEPRVVCELVAPGYTTSTLMKVLNLGQVTTKTGSAKWNQSHAIECHQAGRVSVEFNQRQTDPSLMRQAFYHQMPTVALVQQFTRIRVSTELEEYLETSCISLPRIAGTIYLDQVRLGQPTVSLATDPVTTSVTATVNQHNSPIGTDESRSGIQKPSAPKSKPKARLPNGGSVIPPMVQPKSLEDNMKDLADFVKNSKKK